MARSDHVDCEHMGGLRRGIRDAEMLVNEVQEGLILSALSGGVTAKFFVECVVHGTPFVCEGDGRKQPESLLEVVHDLVLAVGSLAIYVSDAALTCTSLHPRGTEVDATRIYSSGHCVDSDAAMLGR